MITLIGFILLVFLLGPGFTGSALSLEGEEPASFSGDRCPLCHQQNSHPVFPKEEIDRLLGTPECLECHGTGTTAVVQPEDSAVVAAFPDDDRIAQSDESPKAATRKGSRPLPRINKTVFIPAGTFIMGSNDRLPDEGPEHRVSLKDYYIDLYEVTNAQYGEFVRETGRKRPDHWRGGKIPKGKENHPVVFVSWYDARDYCHWAGKRLPTNEEWEKGARGPDGRIFPWGNAFDKNKGNIPLLRIGDTTPVGSFEDGRSYYGLYDMSGNVWEWTSSWYKAYPGNQHPTENYGEKYKTLKGGSWFDCSFYKCGISAPSFNRGFFIPETKNPSFGFRCAKGP